MGACFAEYKVYTRTRMHFTMSMFLHAIIYEILSFLEKEKIYSAGPKTHSVLTLL